MEVRSQDIAKFLGIRLMLRSKSARLRHEGTREPFYREFPLAQDTGIVKRGQIPFLIFRKMADQPEVEEYDLAVRAEHHVARMRIDVELPVKVDHGVKDVLEPGGERRPRVGGARRL